MSKKLFEYNAPVQIKIAALWASLMSCFIYCDYFGLYEKGAIMKMNEGFMGPLGQVTPQIMLGVSSMMAIPSVMICLSVILKPSFNRILNIIFPICYIAIMVASSIGAAQFYMFFATIEIFILLGVLYHAVRWPRQEA
ncbi:MAG: hypothetical protein J0L55_07720 [Caulobacterales bacterium]|nr:hypothetical protein [Caulobacterales bacterium]MCA0373011.1 DUF6326 family protein [Pseudomonadota bacterium]